MRLLLDAQPHCTGPTQDLRPRLLEHYSGHVRHTANFKPIGESETDAYDDLGIHLYYDDHDRLEFVEAFEPALPALMEVPLLGRDYQEVVNDLAKLGYKAKSSDVGYTYEDAGMALTLSGSKIEGVAVFRKGYFQG